jgi:uncharacterized protein DUF4350
LICAHRLRRRQPDAVRERFITLTCALGALLLFGALFWRGGTLSEREASLPTTAERGDNGLLGSLRWLQQQGVPTLSLRERYGTLERRHDLAARGNLLIVTLPASSNFRNDEVVALDRWIRAGNTLLVLAALTDRPSFAQLPRTMYADLQLLTGLSVTHEWEQGPGTVAKGAPSPPPKPGARDKDRTRRELAWLVEELPEPQRRSLVPNQAHPYFEGVATAVAFSDYRPSLGTMLIPRDGFAFTLAHAADSRAGVFWMRPDGAGTILVSGFASLFANRALPMADNARLLANLVAVTVGPRGTVIFDDQHQGLTAAYDPAKFYRDRRLYATIITLALVWLVWVLGGTQLQMPLGAASAPRESELLRTTGLFFARVLRRPVAARRMFENFFGQLRAPRTQDSAVVAPWEWLENHPRLPSADVRQLRQWYADAYADRRVPLVRLHNLILATEGRLAA